MPIGLLMESTTEEISATDFIDNTVIKNLQY